MTPPEVDIWIRGTNHATTLPLAGIAADARQWTDEDVRRLLTEMLLAMDREKNPGGDPPTVTLRGFSWIVSPDDRGGVLVHLEMVTGTASAGPFAIDEPLLSAMIARVVGRVPPQAASTVH
ncbi:MAG: hypothetical protein AB1635_04310 [Acidobacteriota bacterium]